MTEKRAAGHQSDVANDPVNHPSHYTAGKIEVIDFLEDQNFPYHLGNAVKYICRAGRKDPAKTVEDLQKSIWYLNRYIGLIQNADKSNQAAGADVGKEGEPDAD